MSKDNGHVVVYESEAQRLLDQWLWYGGGWQWVLAIAVVFLVARVAWFILTDKKGK